MHRSGCLRETNKVNVNLIDTQTVLNCTQKSTISTLCFSVSSSVSVVQLFTSVSYLILLSLPGGGALPKTVLSAFGLKLICVLFRKGYPPLSFSSYKQDQHTRCGRLYSFHTFPV